MLKISVFDSVLKDVVIGRLEDIYYCDIECLNDDFDDYDREDIRVLLKRIRKCIYWIDELNKLDYKDCKRIVCIDDEYIVGFIKESIGDMYNEISK